MNRILLFIIFFITTTPFLCLSQSSFPISEWKSNLSVKKDVGYLKLDEIFHALLDIDAASRCQAFTQLHNQNGNTRFQIRMSILAATRLCPAPGIHDSLPIHEKLEIALRQSYEINDNVLAARVHHILSLVYFDRNELGLSIIHQLATKELMEKEGLQQFRSYAMMLYRAADLLYHSGDYRAAAKLNEQSLHYHGTSEFNPMDSLNNYWKMNAWNSLGLCYEHLMIYDSAMIAFGRAHSLAHDEFWKALIMGNRGDVFYLQGRYDSAEALLQKDYVQSLAQGEFTNAAITMQRLARITNARGDPKTALSMLRNADSLEHKSQNRECRSAILYSYALVYKDLGMADSSFAYMEKHKALSDSIGKYTAANKVEIAQLRLNNKENIHEIESLRKDKNRIRLIRNFSIALILAFAAFGLVYINRMRLKAMLKQQEALEAKRNAEMETAHAKEQLSIFTESLREKTNLIDEMQLRSKEREQHREQIENMQELTTYTILTDADWERFKNLFTKVYPGFFIELRQHVPDITLAEQRMAALIKLHIPNKDAAGMLGISHNSIHKTRQRLRQRLGIEKDEEMDVFFRDKMGGFD